MIKTKSDATKSSFTSSNIVKPASYGLGIDGTDFISDGAVKNQTCVLLFGYGGCGKTTFVTRYAPDPIALVNFDRRAENAIRKARKDYGKTIFKAEIGYPGNILRMGDEKSKQVAQNALDRLFYNMEWAVRESEKGNVRTIAIDTGTELDDIMSVAAKGIIGKPVKDYGASKGLINRQWLSMFLDVRNSQAHFIVLARAAEIWKSNEPTGRYKHKVSETVYDSVDWAGQVRLKTRMNRNDRKKFELEITKAGVNIAELGETYSEDEWEDVGGPFIYACMLQYEGSSMEDWQ